MRSLALTPLLLLLACGGASTPEADATSRRATPSGELVGFETAEGAHAWLGIPFAAAPVGAQRWRAPRPAPAWEGVRQALSHGPACMQFANIGAAAGPSGEPVGSEDCLSLDVYAPRFVPDEVPDGVLRMPVMVWIHGGGNTVGDASLYDGSVLAVQRDVVVVAIQYRLGAFGWFSHASLRADASPDDRSGNYGTLDAIRALEWVRENIEAFGGDPSRVTLFGESAGGRNVLALLRSPRAAGLFHRAIAQSGRAHGNTLAEAENRVDAAEPGHRFSSGEVILRLLQDEGRAADRAAAKTALAGLSQVEVATWLRGKPAAEILRAYDPDTRSGLYRSPQLLRDGHVLSADAALDAYRQGDYNRVPTILGTNRDEQKLFLLLSSPHVRRIFGLPIGLANGRLYEAEARHTSLSWKAMGVDEPASAMRAAQGPSVYGYRFDWDGEPAFLWVDLGRWLGAAHVLEIPFVFGRLSMGRATPLLFDPEHEEQDLALSRAMTSYWTHFAYTGKPGRGRQRDLPAWQPWESRGGSFLVLDAPAEERIRMSQETVTRAAVIAGVADDPSFQTAMERCAVYRALARPGGVMEATEYAGIEQGACLAELGPPLD